MSGRAVGPARRVRGALGDVDRAALRRLADAASVEDRASALSEDALLRARTGGDVVHLLVDGDGPGLAGYAQLVEGAEPEGELLVDPTARRGGLGAALLAEVDALAAGRPVRLWSHGDTAGAAALAGRAGWVRARELLRLERPAAGLLDLPVPALPDGVAVDAFRPGEDDAAWTALNAAAFAAHPEQGRWTVDDLRLRQRETWFDPSVLLLARDAGAGSVEGLVGSCWMKVEPHAAELYVLAVAPGRGGAGLGRALLVRGLRAVAAAAGAPAVVELYVDGDNVPAVRLYEGLGFARAAVDVQYARA